MLTVRVPEAAGTLAGMSVGNATGLAWRCMKPGMLKPELSVTV